MGRWVREIDCLPVAVAVMVMATVLLPVYDHDLFYVSSELHSDRPAHVWPPAKDLRLAENHRPMVGSWGRRSDHHLVVRS